MVKNLKGWMGAVLMLGIVAAASYGATMYPDTSVPCLQGDLVTAVKISDSSSKFVVLRKSGTTFTQVAEYWQDSNKLYSDATFADLGSDGNLDMIAAYNDPGYYPPHDGPVHGHYRLYTWNPTTSSWDAGTNPYNDGSINGSTGAGDMDRNGQPDVTGSFTWWGAGGLWHLGRSAPDAHLYEYQGMYQDFEKMPLAAGDLDNDGAMDDMVLSNTWGSGSAMHLHFYHANADGSGITRNAYSLDAGEVFGLEIMDIDGDGLNELVGIKHTAEGSVIKSWKVNMTSSPYVLSNETTWYTTTDSLWGLGNMPVPEPATMCLLAVGGLMALLRKKR